MIFYGVSHAQWLGTGGIGDVVEMFLERAEAEEFVRECVKDVPEWADVLSVVEIELHGPAEPSLS